MTLEELLEEVKDRGLLVNNLFQLDDGSWQCNLRKVDGVQWVCCAFALEPTPHAAILEALSKPLDFPAIEVGLLPADKPRLTLRDIGLKK